MSGTDAPAGPAFDPRLTPARPDLAAERLRGQVEAERYAAPRAMRVAVPVANLFSRPDNEGGARGLASQLMLGARFEVYEIEEGLAWGQCLDDSYVGYVPAEALEDEAGEEARFRVSALLAQAYPEPDIKTVPRALLPLNARLAGEAQADPAGEDGKGWVRTRFGHVPAQQLAPVQRPAEDWVAVAESFLGAPYLWGGGSAWGIDCSGLMQAARQAAGYAFPRDSDMQQARGEAVSPEALARGDLVFWRGHVGVMLDAETLLHANAHHMACAREPLAPAILRIKAAGGGAPTAYRRLDAAPEA